MKRLDQLSARECHFPTGSAPNGEHLFCAAPKPADPDRRYCPEHELVAFRSPPNDTKRQARARATALRLGLARFRARQEAPVLKLVANNPPPTPGDWLVDALTETLANGVVDHTKHDQPENTDGVVNIADIMGEPEEDPTASLVTVWPLNHQALEVGQVQEPPTGEPIFENMDPTTLLVEQRYQRSLTGKSLQHIRRMVEEWDWRRFRPPVVAMSDYGFEIIDGQHTAMAAATRGMKAIPCMIVEAPQIEARASAFIGQNRDRLQVTAMQLHHAAVAAGDEDACAVEQVCERAGVRLLRVKYGGQPVKPGDTHAIGMVQSLVKRRHAEGAREVLDVLVAAGRAPIQANDIRAAEWLLNEPEYAEQFDPPELSRAIQALGDAAEKEARLYANANCVPLWKGLAVGWFKKTKKRRAT